MKNTAITLLISAAALAITGCSGASDAASTGAEKGAKTVTKAVAAATKAPQSTISQIPSGTYVMDKTHGYVTFSYWHQGYSKPTLRFDDVDAVLILDTQTPANSSVNVTIKSDSIDTAVPKFDGHIKSADMFDVENHPEITFVSTSLTQSGAAHGTLTGDLTMKGVTKPFTLDVTFNKAGESRSKTPMAGFSATGTLLRSEFDIGYAVPFVGDEITINVEAEFSLKQ